LVQRETQEIRDDLETFKVAVEERWLLSSSEAFSAEMPIAIFERDNRAKAQSHLQHSLIQIHMIERKHRPQRMNPSIMALFGSRLPRIADRVKENYQHP